MKKAISLFTAVLLISSSVVVTTVSAGGGGHLTGYSGNVSVNNHGAGH